MAYVLGFFAADGSMVKNKRGSCYIELTSIDREILEKISRVIKSSHKISERVRGERNRTAYRLQIGSNGIFGDLIKLGMTPNKSKIIKFPKIPVKYFPDFVRGYFDGDGNVWMGLIHKHDRKKPVLVILSSFTCGSKNFILSLKKNLSKILNINGGNFQYHDGAYRLRFSNENSLRLYKFMYRRGNGLYLLRKRKIFDSFIISKSGPLV